MSVQVRVFSLPYWLRFLLPDGSVLLNEIAPRPHNSGHYTMDACHTDQFEQHLRCILGLPL